MIMCYRFFTVHNGQSLYFLYYYHGYFMPHIPNAKHQMKPIILTLMALVSFLLYDATDGYHAVCQSTKRKKEE
jgi:hypothetical protein